MSKPDPQPCCIHNDGDDQTDDAAHCERLKSMDNLPDRLLEVIREEIRMIKLSHSHRG